MTSSEWVQVISYFIDAHYKLCFFIYPIYWAMKIVKKILSS